MKKEEEKYLNKVIEYIPYADPEGKNLDIGNDGKSDVWLRAKLEDGIVADGNVLPNKTTTNADFYLIIKLDSTKDIEEIQERKNRLTDTAVKDINPVNPILEIPLGVRVHNLEVININVDSGIKISYPDRKLFFSLKFPSTEFKGTLQFDMEQKKDFLDKIGIPSVNGFRFWKIIPGDKPENYKLMFTIGTPDLFGEFMDEQCVVSLSLKELKDTWTKKHAYRNIGRKIAGKIQDELNKHFDVFIKEINENFVSKYGDFGIIEDIESIHCQLSNNLLYEDSSLNIEVEGPTAIEYIVRLSFSSALEKYLSFNKPYEVKMRAVFQGNGSQVDYEFPEININQNAIDGMMKRVQFELNELASEFGLSKTAIEKIRKNIELSKSFSPLTFDLVNQTVEGKLFYGLSDRCIDIGTVSFVKGKLQVKLTITKDLLEKIAKEGIKDVADKLLDDLHVKGCEYLSDFFGLESIFKWTLTKSECDAQKFEYAWESSEKEKFSIKGKFDKTHKPIKLEVDYKELLAKLNQTIRDKLNQQIDSEYARFGSVYFRDGKLNVPVFLDLEFLSEDSIQIGTFSLNLDGKFTFNNDVNIKQAFSDLFVSKVNEFIGAGLDIDILDQRLRVEKLSSTSDILDNKLVFSCSALLWSNFLLRFDLRYENQKACLENIKVDSAGLDGLVSADMGIAEVRATFEPSFSPIGIKGIAHVSVYGINFPPIDYTLTRDGLDYKFATSFILPGAWPIAPPYVVAIDPCLTFLPEQKIVKGNVVLTVGESGTALANSRLVKINGYVNLPYDLESNIEFGGDLIVCSFLPVMNGKGEIDLKQASFSMQSKTSKLVESILKFNNSAYINGKKMQIKGSSEMKILGIVGYGVDLEGILKDSRVQVNGNGYAHLPVGQFEINAQTKISPGPFAEVSAMSNANIGFELKTGLEIMGTDISKIKGDANVRQARFDIEVLGLELGVTLPGASSLNKDVLINLLKEMFDLKIDIDGLLRIPNINDLVRFDGDVSLPIKPKIGGMRAGFGSGGSGGKKGPKEKSNGGRGQSEENNRAKATSQGKLINGKLTSPKEVGYKREKRSRDTWLGLSSEDYYVQVPFNKFKPEDWPKTFSNLPEGYSKGSMIFNPDEKNDITGQRIESIISKINIEKKNRFNIHDKLSEYTFVTTSLRVSKLYHFQTQGNMYSFCKDSTKSELGVTSNSMLDGTDKFYYNLAINNKDNKIALFVSYRLEEGETIQKNLLTEKLYSDGLKGTDEFLLTNYILLDTVNSQKVPEKLTGTFKIYKRTKKQAQKIRRFKLIGSDETLNDNPIFSDSNRKKIVEDRLEFIEPEKRNLIIVDQGLVFSTDTITNIIKFNPQNKEQSNKLYELTGKVWIEKGAGILELMFARENANIGDRTISSYIEEKLNNGDTALIKSVFDELLRSNGNIDPEVINCTDIGVTMAVINGTSGQISKDWSAEDTKTFIVTNSQIPEINEGISVPFGLANIFGSSYENLKQKFESFKDLKQYFEERKPLMRNYILCNLVMRSNPLKFGKIEDYNSLYFGEDKMILCRFERQSQDSTVYRLLQIKEGSLQGRPIKDLFQTEASPRVILDDFVFDLELSRTDIPNLRLPVPMNTKYEYWKDVFVDQFSDSTKIFISMPETDTTRYVTVLKVNSSNDKKFYWWHPVDGSKSTLYTSSFSSNLDFLRVNSSTVKSGIETLRLLNNGVYGSEKWYGENVTVNPLILLRR